MDIHMAIYGSSLRSRRERQRERERALEAIEKREKTGDGRAWFVVLVLVPVEVGSDDQ